MPEASRCSQERGLGQHARLGWEDVDCPGSVSILLDETPVVLCARSGMDCRPAVLAVVAEAVDVATEVGGIAPAAVQSMALVTHLVVQNVRLDFDLWWQETDREEYRRAVFERG